MDHSMLDLPVHHQLLEFTQTHVHWDGDATEPSHPLLSIFPSIRVFSSESALHIRRPQYWSFSFSISTSNESTLCMRWPKYWSFSLSITPSNEHPGLVSFRMDWLDLLAVQESLLSRVLSSTTVQNHQFFSTQLYLWSSFLTAIHDYWKNHSLDYMDICWQSNLSAF